MADEKRERKEEKALAGTQMGYDAFSPPNERERTLLRAAKNYGKNSVLKMLAKKLKTTRREKTRRILAADYELVKTNV